MKPSIHGDYRGIFAGAVALLVFCLLYGHLLFFGSLVIAGITFLAIGDPKAFLSTLRALPRLYRENDTKWHTWIAVLLMTHGLTMTLQWLVGGGWESVPDLRAYIASSLIVIITITTYNSEATDRGEISDWPFFEQPWWCALIMLPISFMRLLWLWGIAVTDIIKTSRKTQTQ